MEQVSPWQEQDRPSSAPKHDRQDSHDMEERGLKLEDLLAHPGNSPYPFSVAKARGVAQTL